MTDNDASTSSELAEPVTKRSEILFLYDTVTANPNGNPLSANDKPRIDETTGKCIVTDVRLKRFIRDQLDDDGYTLYIKNPSKAEDNNVATRDELFRRVTGIDTESIDEVNGSAAAAAFLENAVDVRYFGATCSFGIDFDGTFPGQFTGPVQFNHGRSLNRVKLNSESKKLSTVVAGSEDAEQGTFAEDNRVQYALIPFHGVVNEVAAENTHLSAEDVERLDSVSWRAIKNQTLTRSKQGHQPRLYMRVEYSTPEFHIGGLDNHLELSQEMDDVELRNITDTVLNITDLLDTLEANSDHIDTLYVNADRHITVEADGETGSSDLLFNRLEGIVGGDSVAEVDPYDTE